MADTVTVMRDSRVGQAEPAPSQGLAGGGGRWGAASRPPPPVEAPPRPIRRLASSVQGLTREPYFRDITFDVRAGEIVVLAGLIGAGRSEMALGLFGAEPHTSGRVELDGRPSARRPRATRCATGSR